MRVLVVGASGAIGTRLVPLLIERGHEVIGTARSPEKTEGLKAFGAEGVVVDALDPQAVRQLVAVVRPDAIIHEATALADMSFGRNFDRTFARVSHAGEALRDETADACLRARFACWRSSAR